MAQPLLLSGQDTRVIDPLAERVSELEEEVRSLRSDLRVAELRAEQAEAKASRRVSKLRGQLSPLYSALRDVFEEMDQIDGGSSNHDTAGTSAIDPRQRAIWDSWKRKIGGKAADAIEALLLHGEMTPQGVAVAIGIHPNNVAKVMYKLNQAGILRKNGRNYALKTQ